MNYKSTRGAEAVSPSRAILSGIAPDGGLYVPEAFPAIFEKLPNLAALSYQEIAYAVLQEFLTDFTGDELKTCIDAAYGSEASENGGFDGSIAPVVRVGDSWFLELFHGATSAFKDMALSILPHLTVLSAKKNRLGEKPVVLTATSGDTGKAALAAFADVPGTYIVVFFPDDGVSYIQKKQMQTQAGNNVLVVGIDGNFDRAQTGVKAIFNDTELNERLREAGYSLTSANSINIGRLLPQIVYYYYAYAQLTAAGALMPGERLDFTVPTGNFGNILAGYYAKRTGLPVGRLLCASNENKVLYDFFTTGVYDSNRTFHRTASPSMDILVSSNLERFLYHLCEDTHQIRECMNGLSTNGRFVFTPPAACEIVSGFASEAEARESIREMYKQGYIMDTHTAVAYAAYSQNPGNNRNVTLATASPYKFAEEVCRAIDPTCGALEGFDAIDRLYTLSAERPGAASLSGIPQNIAALKSKPVLHDRVCRCEHMADTLLDFLAVR